MGSQGAGHPGMRASRRWSSRRRFLTATGSGLAGAAGLWLVACGGGEEKKPAGQSAAQTAQPEAIQRGGVVKMMLPGEPPTYDPHKSVSPFFISTFVYQTLMTFDPDTLAVQPQLIEKWEYADDTTLVLHLRDGIKFHDRPPANGRAVTADDVAYGLKRAATDQPVFLNHTRFEKISTIEAPDQRTVRVRLKEPSASILVYIAGESLLNREQFEAAPDPLNDPRQVIGTGPFLTTEHQAGVGGKLVRNPNYWESGKPYLDGATWTIIADRAAVLAALRTGDLDYGPSLQGSVDGTEKRQLERTNSGITYVALPVTYSCCFLTNNSRPPFNDIRVRRAIDLITDRQQILNLAKSGDGGPTGPIWDKFMPGYGIPDKELLARPGYRPQKDDDLKDAKQLLTAAGFGSGLDLPADGSEYVRWLNLDAVIASVDQFAKVGIKLHVDQVIDRATFLDTELKGTNLFRSFGVAGAVESNDQLRVRYHSKSPRNYQRYVNPDVDRLIDQQDQITDVEKRKTLTVDIQRKIMDDVPVAHLIWGQDYAVIQPWMRGVKPSVQSSTGRPQDWSKTKS